MEEEITDAELLNLAIDNRLINLHVAMPAKVESYDHSKQTVDVVPQLNVSIPDGQGSYITDTLPKLTGVPVAFPRAGGFFISFPIQAGDFVFLVFSERSLGLWRSTGNQGDPGDIGMHTLDGAVAFPCVFPDSKALSNADGTNMIVGNDSQGSARIELTSSGVNLGAGASENVVTKKDLQSLYFAINAAGTVPNDGGAAFKAALLTGLGTAGWTTGTADGQLGSSKIKAVR